MNKSEFIDALSVQLAGLPKDDVAHWLEYYTEMLDDRIEEGMSEREAVASMGEPKDVAKEILGQTSLAKLIKNKIKPKRKLRTWEIVLICVGAPIWIPLAISAIAVFFSALAVLFAGFVSLWAVEVALVVNAFSDVVASVLFLVTGATYQGLLLLGAGLVCAGLAYFGFFLCKWLTVLLVKACKAFLLFVKSLFVKKEASDE